MTKLKNAQRSTPFDPAAFEQAFLAAEYPKCRAMAEMLPPSERRTLLIAKIDWREQRFVEMIEPLSAMRPKNDEVAIERDTLLGGAYGCTRDFTMARVRLDRAIDRAPIGSALRGDALYVKALVAWMEHEHRESETLANEALVGASPNDAARARILISWIALRRRDLERQAAELIAALDLLAEAAQPDEYYRARALRTLALLAKELPLTQYVQRIRETVAVIHWTPALQLGQFQVMRCLGWVDALQGDELSAFRSFRAATALAPSDHWRVLSLTDRAYLARSAGERSFAEDLLHEAHELAQRLSWHETLREERSALFVLAELFAPVA
ncbi:MAG TPA: hypothetical protein VGR69_07115, partial [Candidatus Rubrimentiphilum sp.]|nr:hypothetical protein [Candidatus Rubrimentiphilum sp.]